MRDDGLVGAQGVVRLCHRRSLLAEVPEVKTSCWSVRRLCRHANNIHLLLDCRRMYIAPSVSQVTPASSCNCSAVGTEEQVYCSYLQAVSHTSPQLFNTNSTVSDMAGHEHSHSVADKEVEVPDWEHNPEGNENDTSAKPSASIVVTMRQKLDSIMPSRKKYLGMRRKIFLIVLLASTLALLALVIGLSVGLTQGSKYIALS